VAVETGFKSGLVNIEVVDCQVNQLDGSDPEEVPFKEER